ncbi:EF-P 5-aminopentanol modification-associated protein YfmH [Caproicibacterium sp. NSD3]
MKLSELKEVRSERLGDSYYEGKHPSGLQIYLYPKKQNASTYAIFGTRYGSVDTRFRRSDEKEESKVPAGIAHYLEHKLFESEDGDAFTRYAKTGASANAYTSFDVTCYLFSCTEHVYDSLEILLDFVQSPYFTEQTVKKEQGIIGQEIRMYDDDPDWRVLFNMLEAMYQNHPVKVDIAGTVESIAKITPELLYRCYHTFYNLNNMVLCVVGNIDPQKVLDLCDKMLKPSKAVTVDRIFEPEPETVLKSRIEQSLSVASPLFSLGFKEKAERRATTKEMAETSILLSLLADDCSPLFRRLLDASLINESSFGYENFEGPGYACVIFSGESKEPDAVEKEILKELESYRKNGVSDEAFERAKKTVYGKNVSSFNSVESIANAMASFSFADRSLFAYVDAIANATKEEVLSRLNTQLLPENRVLSIIHPEKA